VANERRKGEAKLSQKIKDALDETRILVLGAQVLVGFAYRGVFQQGFQQLPPLLKALHTTGLGLMLIVLMLLMLPAAYHQISQRGEDTADLREFVTVVAGLALLPFAIAMGLGIFVTTAGVVGQTPSIALGGGTVCAALICWYGLELAGRHNHQEAPMSDEQSQGKTKIEDKIVQVLTEARVVLPGVQALLGFQFITIWSDSFKDLAQSAKLIHVGALLAIALTTIFLMTPAAYHRLVEDGEATEHFHRFASHMLLLALVPLAFGLSADFFVVVEKVTSSFPIAITLSAATLCAFLGLWFGLTLALRLRKHSFPVGLVQHAG
jgi:hypothetical protein